MVSALFKWFLTFLGLIILPYTMTAQTLGSELQYKASYGLKLKKREADLYSDIAICKANSDLLIFPRRGISMMKSPCISVLNTEDGRLKKRKLLLPDSLKRKFELENEDVEAIAVGHNSLALLLLRDVYLFNFDSTAKQYVFTGLLKLPGLGSEIHINNSVLYVFGSYPSTINEYENNFVLYYDFTKTSEGGCKYSVVGYNASAYKILKGTRYSFLSRDELLLVDPGVFNLYRLYSGDTSAYFRFFQKLTLKNYKAPGVSDSIYSKLLVMYRRSPVSLFDELIAAHIKDRTTIIYQVWNVYGRNKLIVIGVPDTNKNILIPNYVVLDSLNNPIKIMLRDSFPDNYIYTNTDYRPYANLGYQWFDTECAIFPRMSAVLDKKGMRQSEVYKKDRVSTRIYWVFDIYKW